MIYLRIYNSKKQDKIRSYTHARDVYANCE